MKLIHKYVRGSTTSGLIGIWWATDDLSIFGVTHTLDEGYNDGIYIQYSDTENHLSLWKRVVYEVFDKPQADEIYKLGYKGLERGRVIYDLRTQCYVVTCSEAMLNNIEFRQEIKKFFELGGCRVDFEALSHYSKLPLTGNPAIDQFIYD